MTAPAPRLTLEPWLEAEANFRRDPRWRGGDDAYSVALGADRHLWLFGDTFVLPSGDGDRRAAHFLNNTIAIQSGSDPSAATIDFHWSVTDDHPRSVFLDHEPPVYLWPGDGVAVDGRLLVFFMRIASGPGLADPEDPDSVVNFRLVGWTARMIDGTDGQPADWSITRPDLPDVPDLAVGFAGVLQHGDFVYAHAIGRDHRKETFVVRWRADDVAAGDLTRPTWWIGDGWGDDSGAAAPTGLRALTEFTVHHDERADRFLAVQMVDLKDARLEIRSAPTLTGPWSAPVVYRPPQAGDPDVNIYAGKAHPDIRDERGILVTYATNGATLATVLDRESLYYPHCLRLVPD
jgi:hypothetical protein